MTNKKKNNNPRTVESAHRQSSSPIRILKDAVKEVANPVVSRFNEWDSESLKQLLVENNVQIRGSANAPHETLVRICDEVFGPVDDGYFDNSHDVEDGGEGQERETGRNGELSLNTSLFNFEDLTKMNWAALKIQRLFIASRQRMYDRIYSSHNDKYHHEGDYYYQEDEGDCDLHVVEDNLPNSLATDSILEDERYDEECAPAMHETHLYQSCKESNIEQTNHEKRQSLSEIFSSNETVDDLDGELDTEWRKPSWKFAKKYEAENRPHKSGKTMAQYEWRKATLGRHCTMGGCGEQLDLWNEGATSEFSQFGSGITNYFKASPHQMHVCYFVTIS